MLHALVKIQRLKSLHVEVAHVDHGLRPESSEDARFVQARCGELGVPCHLVRLGPKPPSENMEAWARRERYGFFRTVMREHDLHHLLTAHTANDVAETLLMRLIANKELNTIEESDEERGCLRPMLDIARSQIDEYVTEHGVPFVEDVSNEDTSLTRNRIRKVLIPLLQEEFDSSVIWSLSERAQEVAADCSALQCLADRAASHLGEVRFDTPEWRKGCQDTLGPLPHAVRWRVVQVLFSPLLGFTVGQGRAEAILEVLCGAADKVDLGGSRTLVVRRGALYLE
jgi:tRNA(Ile)-lysidine synthase